MCHGDLDYLNIFNVRLLLFASSAFFVNSVTAVPNQREYCNYNEFEQLHGFIPLFRIL